MIGIDIPISRFESFAPRNQLGPLGKSFAVNENGFLIFHPSLWTVSNYLEDPAHNDLEEIEGDSEAISSLRKAMIDLATSQDLSSSSREVPVIQGVPTSFRYKFARNYNFEIFCQKIRQNEARSALLS